MTNSVKIVTGPEDKKANRYEELIQGKVPARNLQEKIIQKHTKTDAGLVLAIIGLEHPASVTVHRYLLNQKYGSISPKSRLIRYFIKNQFRQNSDGGYGMKKGHDGKETNRSRIAEQQSRKIVACGFRARARKYWEDFKSHNGKGKISDPDSFEHIVEIFNESKKNFIFTEILKIHYRAKDVEVALEALKLLIEAAKLE